MFLSVWAEKMIWCGDINVTIGCCLVGDGLFVSCLSMKYILQSWGGFTFVCFCDLTVLLEIPLWVLLYWCIIEFACMCVLWSFPATGLIRLRKVLHRDARSAYGPMDPHFEAWPRRVSKDLECPPWEGRITGIPPGEGFRSSRNT